MNNKKHKPPGPSRSIIRDGVLYSIGESHQARLDNGVDYPRCHCSCQMTFACRVSNKKKLIQIFKTSIPGLYVQTSKNIRGEKAKKHSLAPNRTKLPGLTLDALQGSLLERTNKARHDGVALIPSYSTQSVQRADAVRRIIFGDCD